MSPPLVLPRRSAAKLLAAVVLLSIAAGCARDRAANPAATASSAAATPPAGAGNPTKAESTPGSAAASSASTTEKGTAKKDAPPKTPDPKAAAAAKKAADAEKEKARQAAAEQVPVETSPITRGPIASFLSFNSTLETEAVVDIYPQTTGQVEALLVEEGRVVKQGEALLKIEDRELRVDADESTSNFEHLNQGFARIEGLYHRNLVNKQEYDDARYQLEQAKLRLERAKLRLSYATVRAPFDGVISARETQVGARVGTGTKLFSMVKLDEIVARVFVPGRYLSIIVENQPAVVTSEYLPDRRFKGWVKRVSPVIDPKSGTFKVTVGVRGDKPTDLPPGLFVAVRVITDTKQNAVLIPKRALVYEGGERFVFTVDKGRAQKRKLTPGYEDPDNIEALSGFEAGTQIIVLGQSGLKDGSLVRSVNPPAATGGPVGPVAPPAPATPPARTSTAAATEPAKSG